MYSTHYYFASEGFHENRFFYITRGYANEMRSVVYHSEAEN